METKTKTWIGAVVFALGLAGATPASAATLDFTGISGNQGASLVLSNATINVFGGGNVLVGIGAAGESDGFCFLDVRCTADGEILFDNPISNLTFDVDGANTGDSVEITAFNGGNDLGSLTATANGQLDFSGFGTLTRLFFDDSSTGGGVGYSTFQFDEQQQMAIPVPASLPLILGGLGLLGLVGRRGARGSGEP